MTKYYLKTTRDALLATLAVLCVMAGAVSLWAADAPALRSPDEIAQDQRDLRDACEAQRKAAQDAGDDEARQYWLVQRRLVEAMISARELRRATVGADAPADPPEVEPVPEPVSPGATIRHDAQPGEIGDLLYYEATGEILLMARVAAGDRIVAQSWHVDAGEVLTDWLTDADVENLRVYGDAEDGAVPRAMAISAASLANLPAGRHEVQVWVVSVEGLSPFSGIGNPARVVVEIR